MIVIAGLGNPTRKNEHTRHNAGFDAVDLISKEQHIDFKRTKFRGVCGTGTIEDKEVMLIKPLTYMNLSGTCLWQAVNELKLDVSSELIVIYDDVSLDPGNIRIRKKGSDGGHNGIKDIINRLGTEEFMRIRIGIGQNPPDVDLKEYVLQQPDEEERVRIDDAISRAAEAAVMMVRGEVDEAMNQFNKKVEYNESLPGPDTPTECL